MKRILHVPLLLVVLTVITFFQPYFFQGKLPIPADTIIGLYHPFRDLYAADYPNGIPYKNFLITDPVRQQYPWRQLAIESLKQGNLPLWNPYTMAGTPLLANVQSAPLYPFNVILFILPFASGWSFLILLQPLLAGIFLYFYLTNLSLNRFASAFGAVTFSFSGFIISWLEWGTIGHTALWLPLVLLSIDKLFRRKNYAWSFILIFSLVSSLLAGHLQTFFYLFSVSTIYFFVRWFQFKKETKILLLFVLIVSCFLVLTFIQWFTAFQFIAESARSVDQIDWHKSGWFIPWQHLVQFIAPDFFGNPTTLNYWGEWNYGEFVGYIGIVPLIMALFALFTRHDKKTFFFGALGIVSLLFAFPTIISQLPYQLHIPFISTTQPTRLLFVTDFAFAVLAALGLDYFLKTKKKKRILYALGVTGLVFIGLWIFVLFGSKFMGFVSPENITVAKRNLYIPTFFFIGATIVFSLYLFHFSLKRINKLLLVLLFVLTAFDLLRFSQKFTPFTDSKYLFPPTKVLSYLQKQEGQFRIMSTDSRILPPNFSVMYGLQTLDGYDPLYLLRYGELIAAIQREKPDISAPFGFNRIITPQNYESRLIDLLGVTYVLSLKDIKSPKLQFVFSEGQTKVYRNNRAFPRAFFVENIVRTPDRKQSMAKLFDSKIDLRKTAILELDDDYFDERRITKGTAEIISYKENEVTVKTQNRYEGFLVLMDSYYPTWDAKICTTKEGNCTKLELFRTNYNFRGIFVPAGKHYVIFYNSLL